MLVGAGEIDAALVVVAADDGPRAQTLEHLELLDALGIADGLAVVTKVDVVEPARAAEVVAAVRATAGRDDPRRRAGRSRSRGRAATGSSRAPGGAGRRCAIGSPAARRSPTGLAFRDRSGLLDPGTRHRRDRLAARWLAGPRRRPARRAGRAGPTIRVRELQVHGRTVERAAPGRVAINVAGADAVPGWSAASSSRRTRR